MKKIFLSAILLSFVFVSFGQLKTVKGNFGETGDLSHLKFQKDYLRTENIQSASDPLKFQNKEFIRPEFANPYGLRVHSRSLEGLPLFIEGKSSLATRNGSSLEERAADYIYAASDLLQIENADKSFDLVKISEDQSGAKHIRYQQHHNGIPVYGGEIILHTDGNEIISLNGRYHKIPDNLPSIPSKKVSESEEILLATAGEIVMNDEDQFGLFDFERLSSKLIYYPIGKSLKLSYHHTIYTTLLERWEYFIDAENGKILHQYESICRFHNHHKEENTSLMPPPDGPTTSNADDLFNNNIAINTYEFSSDFYMIDASRDMYDASNSSIPESPVGAVWTLDAFNTSPDQSSFTYDNVVSSSNNWNNREEAVSAHFNGGVAYEYYKNVHQRESIDGQRGSIISLVNITDQNGNDVGNAFWNGLAMFYGNGDSNFKPLARGLDVAGHEMTHGVIQNTANLEYLSQSGALNESFADIFGAMIDRDDWLIGEDVVQFGAFPGGALRSLSDPHNGANTNDFGNGWQPKHMDEYVTLPETPMGDNGGVHINSGIPNHAFFLFANDIGKDKAEKVYYHALSNYLVKSSQFIDARLAVVKSAGDLYGNTEVNAAKAAFDGVGILNGNATNTQTDVNLNPGSDLVLFTTNQQQNIYVFTPDGTGVFNPLSEKDPISKPSVTDDGSEVLFVGTNGKLQYVFIDWEDMSTQEQEFGSGTSTWRNAVFSKDGLRMAALPSDLDNTVFIYDFVSGVGRTFEFYNPTFTSGVSTGDVLYADAMEFDITGEYLLYDANNALQSSSGGSIEYWDIGLMKVWNNDTNNFSLGQIEKLFPPLPEGISIGNPTYSKNSPYIIAFDYLENNQFSILGNNTETGEVEAIFENNNQPGYPSYSINDENLIFDASSSNSDVIAITDLQDDKISSVPETAFVFFEGARWGSWFGNGDRVLSGLEELDYVEQVKVFPNPTSGETNISFQSELSSKVKIAVIDIKGKVVWQSEQNITSGTNEFTVDLSALQSGSYILQITDGQKQISKMISKI